MSSRISDHQTAPAVADQGALTIGAGVLDIADQSDTQAAVDALRAKLNELMASLRASGQLAP